MENETTTGFQIFNSTDQSEEDLEILRIIAIVCVTFYAAIGVAITVLLGVMCSLRHKMKSCQTLFLLFCLAWVGLRIAKFSYFACDAAAASRTNDFTYWVFYPLPKHLQFLILCNLIPYFFRIIENGYVDYVYEGRCNSRRDGCLVFIFFFVFYFAVNVTSDVLVRYNVAMVYEVVLLRNIVSQMVIMGCVISLGVCIKKLMHLLTTRPVRETRYISRLQSSVFCFLLIPLHGSLALYNFITFFQSPNLQGLISFNFGWFNFADLDKIREIGYGSFAIMMLIWEYAPICAVVIFFRVRKCAFAGAYNNLGELIPVPSPGRGAVNPRTTAGVESLHRTLSGTNPARESPSPSTTLIDHKTRGLEAPASYGSVAIARMRRGESSSSPGSLTTARSQPPIDSPLSSSTFKADIMVERASFLEEPLEEGACGGEPVAEPVAEGACGGEPVAEAACGEEPVAEPACMDEPESEKACEDRFQSTCS